VTNTAQGEVRSGGVEAPCQQTLRELKQRHGVVERPRARDSWTVLATSLNVF